MKKPPIPAPQPSTAELERLEIALQESIGAVRLSFWLAKHDQAKQLHAQYWRDYEQRLQAAIAEARQQWLSGPTWARVETLREQLGRAADVLSAAQERLGAVQHEYSARLSTDGDASSLLSELGQRQLEAEAASKAAQHFEKQVQAAEDAARQELRRTLMGAASFISQEAGRRFREGAQAIVQAIDPQTLLALAVEQRLSKTFMGGAFQGAAAPGAIWPELTSYVDIPERQQPQEANEPVAVAEADPPDETAGDTVAEEQGDGQADVAEASSA